MSMSTRRSVGRCVHVCQIKSMCFSASVLVRSMSRGLGRCTGGGMSVRVRVRFSVGVSMSSWSSVRSRSRLDCGG